MVLCTNLQQRPVPGSIVVIHNVSGFISPRPLYRLTAIPFLPAAMKKSTKASAFSSVASASLRDLAPPTAAGAFASEGPLVASSAGAAPPSAPASVPSRFLDLLVNGDGVSHSHDHREGHVPDLAIGGLQGAIFAGRDEIHADVVGPGISLRPILDRQPERVVLVVATDRHGAQAGWSCEPPECRACRAARRTTCLARRRTATSTRCPVGCLAASPAAGACGNPSSSAAIAPTSHRRSRRHQRV